jgi:sec-independent protein translocase protein TatA
MLSGLSPVHLLIVLAIFVLLFGARRLPDAARGVGRSLRIFKSEVKAAESDDQGSDGSGTEATKRQAVEPDEKPRH